MGSEGTLKIVTRNAALVAVEENGGMRLEIHIGLLLNRVAAVVRLDKTGVTVLRNWIARKAEFTVPSHPERSERG